MDLYRVGFWIELFLDVTGSWDLTAYNIWMFQNHDQT